MRSLSPTMREPYCFLYLPIIDLGSTLDLSSVLSLMLFLLLLLLLLLLILKLSLLSLPLLLLLQFLPLTLPLPKSDGTFFADVFIAMIVEMLDGGQIELTEDTQVMICYATSTHTVGSTKKKDLGSARIARIEKKD